MNISPAFNRPAEDGYVRCPIPGSREPEFGLILENMADHISVYDALCADPNVRILPLQPQPEKYLVSFAEDTVGPDHVPTQEMKKLGLERRRRLSYYPHDMSFQRFDISVKDALKSSHRREWEQASTCIRTGEEELLAKLGREIPLASKIDPLSFRVSSICITSRASYDIEHELPGENARIGYEICNDACVQAGPHADQLLGYRREVELEAKYLKVGPGGGLSPERCDDLLDKSIAVLESRLYGLKPLGSVAPASISKVRHANDVVRLDYERNMIHSPQIHDGLQWALLQNVRAWEYMDLAKREAIGRLVETIPSPDMLMPGQSTATLQGYFPGHYKYPLLPG